MITVRNSIVRFSLVGAALLISGWLKAAEPASPSDLDKALEQLKSVRIPITRPGPVQSAAQTRLGVFLEVLDETLASQLDLPAGQGLVVRQVTPNSVAAKAGLKPLDILLEMGGRPVSSDIPAFDRAVQALKADLPVNAAVLRKGNKTSIADLSFPDPGATSGRDSAARSPLMMAGDIDRAVSKQLNERKIPASPRADDAEFLRRACLDITGRIPSTELTVAFLESNDPDKRRKLIDGLLASPLYGHYFAAGWEDLIVKRDANNRSLDAQPFRSWLADRFNQGHGWDQIVGEMLTAEGPVSRSPQGIFFLAHRGDQGQVAPNKVVSTVANLFMGIQLQCAECHDHRMIKDWKRTDFWGMAAFFAQTRSTGLPFQQVAIAGRPGVELAITESALAPGAVDQFGRRIGGNQARPAGAVIEIPDAVDPRKKTGQVKAKFLEGDQPELGTQGPFRVHLAAWLTSPDNKYFAPAAVNRLWAHFFARGFVNSLEDFHPDNPPSHPELLDMLVRDFKASGHDVKYLIRAICNSEAYQRTSRPLPENQSDSERFSHQTVKVMTPEVLYDSLCLALGVNDLAPPATNPQGRQFVVVNQARQPASPREQFVSMFTGKEGPDNPAEWTLGVPQILRLMNSALLNQGGPIIERLLKVDSDPAKMIEALYLATLSRRPTADEAAKCAAFVARKNDPKGAYAGLLWVLLNSGEFLCNR
jgi:hypothetical protein